MDGSILNDIKKMLGMDSDYTAFDLDVRLLVNAALMILQQLGVVPKNGFAITGNTEKWSDFLDSEKNLEGVKEYIYLKVKTIFDPPTNSFVMEAYQKMIDELEWRLKEQMESYPGDLPRQEAEGDADAV